MLNRRVLGALWVLAASVSYAATFGTVVPVRGTVSDIALDERRGKLYVANFSAGTIEVMNTTDLSLSAPMVLSFPPSSIALSPDNRYLVVGHYYSFPVTSTPVKGGITVIDLDGGVRQESVFNNPVLAVAFGSGSRALVVTTGELMLLEPSTATAVPLATQPLGGAALPVPFNTFPPNIVEASAGVSGDGSTIIVLAAPPPPGGSPTEGPGSVLLRYRVGESAAKILPFTSTPSLGPRAVSVNRDGSNFLAGWTLLNSDGVVSAQFPYITGRFRAGGHAFDFARDRIYADIPVAAGEAPVMHIVDTDNLTVRERIQLPQMMSGRSVFSSDMKTLYGGSDSGVIVLPVGSLTTAPRLAAMQEDLIFQGDACNRSGLSQTIDIVDLGGGSVDFTLSLPPNAVGIRLSQDSGTTPARVRVDVDPTPFQNTKGTTTVMMNLTSSRGINIPFPVRLLINTRDFNQQGRTVNVPGKVVDILADRIRNRMYVARQDRNLVLVYDMTSTRQIAALRTGNTPMGMATTDDERYLIVGNDNSQLASVFDLETLQPSQPILFPNSYPHMIAVGHGAIWATVREVGTANQSRLYKIDFPSRMANPPATLGIFANGTPNSIPPTAALAASPSRNSILLAMADGTVALWDASVNQWVVSRKDVSSLGGAFGALTDKLFLADNYLFNESLFPVATLTSQGGTSSGAAVLGGTGLRTNAGSAATPGILERIDLTNLFPYHGTETTEAPMIMSTLQTPPIGQIGQTILPFTRTLAVLPDQSSAMVMSQSGFTVVPWDFDSPKPLPVISAVVNAADGGEMVASGGLVQLSGTGLASGSAAAGTLPLPFALSNVCVELNSKAIPLMNLSSTNITAQLPFDFTGRGSVIVSNAGGKSSPFSLDVQSAAPAIFHSGTAGPATGIPLVVRTSNNSAVSLSNPVHINDTLLIYSTGLGRTTPEPALGAASPSDPLATANAVPTVTLGGVPLDVQFAGLVPGQVGVYQINAFVPGAVREGIQLPLQIAQGSQSTTLDVRVVKP